RAERSRAGRGVQAKRSGRRIARLTPVAASTDNTRSAGMRDQFDTDGWEMPIFRASAPTPPATRIASSSPTSLIGAFLYYYSSTVEKYRPRRAMVNSSRLRVPASLGQSAPVRPFPNQLIVIGVF